MNDENIVFSDNEGFVKISDVINNGGKILSIYNAKSDKLIRMEYKIESAQIDIEYINFVFQKISTHSSYNFESERLIFDNIMKIINKNIKSLEKCKKSIEIENSKGISRISKKYKVSDIQDLLDIFYKYKNIIYDIMNSYFNIRYDEDLALTEYITIPDGIDYLSLPDPFDFPYLYPITVLDYNKRAVIMNEIEKIIFRGEATDIDMNNLHSISARNSLDINAISDWDFAVYNTDTNMVSLY